MQNVQKSTKCTLLPSIFLTVVPPPTPHPKSHIWQRTETGLESKQRVTSWLSSCLWFSFFLRFMVAKIKVLNIVVSDLRIIISTFCYPKVNSIVSLNQQKLNPLTGLSELVVSSVYSMLCNTSPKDLQLSHTSALLCFQIDSHELLF